MPSDLRSWRSLGLAAVAAVSLSASVSWGQAPAAPAESPPATKVSQTVIQIETAALVLAAATLGGTLGKGIHSAAKVITTYLEARDVKESARDQAHAAAMEKVASVVERYHADRQTSTAAIADLAEAVTEEIDEIRDLIADAANQPRRPRKPRVKRSVINSDDTREVSKIGDAEKSP